MRVTRLTMGMPVTVEVVDATVTADVIDRVFAYFRWVDETFSPFKATSEVERMNRGELQPREASEDLRQILRLAEQTKQQTDGYFDVGTAPHFNPSGIVKGWAIWQVAQRLCNDGWQHFYVDAGGDIQAHGLNAEGSPWRVGIRNPFNVQQIIKVILPGERGVATSGTYERGEHIYNPKDDRRPVNDVVSLTVIGPNVYDADRFATAAFAMGRAGISFLENLPGYDAYAVDPHGTATMTSAFSRYVANDV